jgi:cytochrome b pre-mRNA-processing protein 3
MIFSLFRKPKPPYDVHEAYRSIVAQSRQVQFYADWGVPDTVTGRFDMVSLQLVMLLSRLRPESGSGPFIQALIDHFFLDMDRSVRELGVTDLGVAKKIKSMGNLFYGLAKVLGPALESGDAAEVEAVLVRNVYGDPHPGAAKLSAYLIDEFRRLQAEPASKLMHFSGEAA